MKYEGKFQINPKDWEKLRQFIQAKSVPAVVETDTQPYKAGGIPGTINVPIGLATITFETANSQLCKEFDDLISKLEKEYRDELFSHLLFPPL
jgi:hypothetical protein